MSLFSSDGGIRLAVPVSEPDDSRFETGGRIGASEFHDDEFDTGGVDEVSEFCAGGVKESRFEAENSVGASGFGASGFGDGMVSCITGFFVSKALPLILLNIFGTANMENAVSPPIVNKAMVI